MDNLFREVQKGESCILAMGKIASKCAHFDGTSPGVLIREIGEIAVQALSGRPVSESESEAPNG